MLHTKKFKPMKLYKKIETYFQKKMINENYSIMNMLWILILVSSSGVFKSNISEKYIEHYKVFSPILTKLVETTIDSCQSRIRCDVFEYMIIKFPNKYSVRLETLR